MYGRGNPVIIARVALLREFVNFSESHFPTFFTYIVSLVDLAFMLFSLELKVVLACAFTMAIFAVLLPGYVRRNDRLEKEVIAINAGERGDGVLNLASFCMGRISLFGRWLKF